jgi:hypothetical protein
MERASSVEIQIDVLEVEGIAFADAGRFRRGVERELRRLVWERGLPSASGVARSFVSVETEPSAAGYRAGSDSHARAVASVIYRGLVR